MAIDLAKVGAASPPVPGGGSRNAVAEKKEASGERLPAKQNLLVRLGQFEVGNRNASLDDILLVTQQLALLIETGNGLAPSVEALASQAGSPALRKVLRDVHSRLEQGSEFSECLKHHPKVFDGLYVSLVRAGEASGALRESLLRISGVLEVRRQLHTSIREAMTYPAVLLVIMTGAVIFLFAYMVPRFGEIFDALGNELPASTRLMLGLGDAVRGYWWVAVPLLALAVFGVKAMGKVGAVRSAWDRIKIRAPLVGAMVSEAYLFQLFSTLGLLLGSRVPHLEAIRITERVVRNIHYKAFFVNLMRHVESGNGVSRAFQEANFLPNPVKLMVATGETSGALDRVMERLADNYRENLGTSIRKFSSLLEPMMLIVMGALVGFIAISFILPILKMSRAIH